MYICIYVCVNGGHGSFCCGDDDGDDDVVLNLVWLSIEVKSTRDIAAGVEPFKSLQPPRKQAQTTCKISCSRHLLYEGTLVAVKAVGDADDGRPRALANVQLVVAWPEYLFLQQQQEGLETSDLSPAHVLAKVVTLRVDRLPQALPDVRNPNKPPLSPSTVSSQPTSPTADPTTSLPSFQQPQLPTISLPPGLEPGSTLQCNSAAPVSTAHSTSSLSTISQRRNPTSTTNSRRGQLLNKAAGGDAAGPLPPSATPSRTITPAPSKSAVLPPIAHVTATVETAAAAAGPPPSSGAAAAASAAGGPRADGFFLLASQWSGTARDGPCGGLHLRSCAPPGAVAPAETGPQALTLELLPQPFLFHFALVYRRDEATAFQSEVLHQLGSLVRRTRPLRVYDMTAGGKVAAAPPSATIAVSSRPDLSTSHHRATPPTPSSSKKRPSSCSAPSTPGGVADDGTFGCGMLGGVTLDAGGGDGGGVTAAANLLVLLSPGVWECDDVVSAAEVIPYRLHSHAAAAAVRRVVQLGGCGARLEREAVVSELEAYLAASSADAQPPRPYRPTGSSSRKLIPAFYYEGVALRDRGGGPEEPSAGAAAGSGGVGAAAGTLQIRMDLSYVPWISESMPPYSRTITLHWQQEGVDRSAGSGGGGGGGTVIQLGEVAPGSSFRARWEGRVAVIGGEMRLAEDRDDVILRPQPFFFHFYIAGAPDTAASGLCSQLASSLHNHSCPGRRVRLYNSCGRPKDERYGAMDSSAAVLAALSRGSWSDDAFCGDLKRAAATGRRVLFVYDPDPAAADHVNPGSAARGAPPGVISALLSASDIYPYFKSCWYEQSACMWQLLQAAGFARCVRQPLTEDDSFLYELQESRCELGGLILLRERRWVYYEGVAGMAGAMMLSNSYGELLRLVPQSHIWHYFLSYVEQDTADACVVLAVRLGEVSVQGRRLRCWYDSHVGGSSAAARCREARRLGVEHSQHFVLLLSPGALESPYIRFEIQTALDLHKSTLVLYDPDSPSPTHLDLAHLRASGPQPTR
ncbi:hypothetical protein VOLCADRAFT_108129 [Volvox carteri f. nagariensis]|uniref:TIR domain-containing protein n=1 Tax=Volvox carteri f. nagariensis TaxID=3068 RepID=D8UIF7_VOLCA|nr:uncharacterized protein VOLCADRAFT_108129 [Volvox carteri f. nagariensis]EFJ40502.1 hypothetical protein VOLCADRAFT_108129 [Volvox carteri f. nagariensis]|eukprot:XP_002958426.1 hypothetical protein VOLCADRAFT_108129 [Volvox carteri f. nagariensis]